MSDSVYSPEPGTLAWRICNWFGMTRNRAEERTAQELAQQFEAKRTVLVNELGAAVKAALLTWSEGERQWVYKAGPALDAWVRGQTAPAATAPKAAKRGGPRKHLPPLDIAKLEVRIDVPLPEKAGPGTRPAWWPKVLEKLQQPGASVVLPLPYMSGAKKAVQTHCKDKSGIKFEFRRLNDEQFGIWRTA